MRPAQYDPRHAGLLAEANGVVHIDQLHRKTGNAHDIGLKGFDLANNFVVIEVVELGV